MKQKKEFKCECCGKSFSPTYRISSKKDMKYCSKKCLLDSVRMNQPQYFNKTQLENSIIKEINNQGKYLTIQDICDSLKISSKTLTKFRISILTLNKKCGMKKPKSIFEGKVLDYLESKYELVLEKTFDTCLSPKGYKLRFDFFIESHNVLIEADGTQHYDDKNQNYSEYQRECDEIKNKWCIENNVNLIRIPYCRKITNEYLDKIIII